MPKTIADRLKICDVTAVTDFSVPGQAAPMQEIGKKRNDLT